MLVSVPRESSPVAPARPRCGVVQLDRSPLSCASSASFFCKDKTTTSSFDQSFALLQEREGAISHGPRRLVVGRLANLFLSLPPSLAPTQHLRKETQTPLPVPPYSSSQRFPATSPPPLLLDARLVVARNGDTTTRSFHASDRCTGGRDAGDWVQQLSVVQMAGTHAPCRKRSCGS